MTIAYIISGACFLLVILAQVYVTLSLCIRDKKMKLSLLVRVILLAGSYLFAFLLGKAAS